MTACPYGNCTYVGTDAEVDEHIVYTTSMGIADHAEELRGVHPVQVDVDDLAKGEKIVTDAGVFPIDGMRMRVTGTEVRFNNGWHPYNVGDTVDVIR